jgi:hypothetical protein
MGCGEVQFVHRLVGDKKCAKRIVFCKVVIEDTHGGIAQTSPIYEV